MNRLQAYPPVAERRAAEGNVAFSRIPGAVLDRRPGIVSDSSAEMSRRSCLQVKAPLRKLMGSNPLNAVLDLFPFDSYPYGELAGEQLLWIVP